MSTVAYNNVLFICAARMAGQAIVVASYSYNTDTDLSAVKQALEQPSMNLSPGKHYSFNAGPNAWHFISGTPPLQITALHNLYFPSAYIL
jgi:hypothetical protein